MAKTLNFDQLSEMAENAARDSDLTVSEMSRHEGSKQEFDRMGVDAIVTAINGLTYATLADARANRYRVS
jgi:hypothetical protein